jgi:alkanesulfonate monooxygenase SsuD/methylene tetrahydromethanopterin reductase-like flavin-dependent oxidoreductase (luciferase family)
MDIGLCVASRIDDIDYVQRAEALGYRHAWFADSQMIWSDCYAALALVATRTTTMRLGTGVSVVGTRLAPVTAHSIATINALAPGRTFLALGNGNTAWRLMGHKPVTLAAFEEYLSVCRGLLDGDEVDFTHRGRTERISFQMADLGFIAIEPRIPIYVSGFGPRAQALAGRYGEGLVMSIPPDPAAFERIWANVVHGADAAGRTVDRREFLTCSLSCACVLRPGEDLTSGRVIDTVGSFAISSYHYAYDRIRNYGGDPPPHLANRWEEYCALVESVPEAARHNRIHIGHCTWLAPEERTFVTPDLIRRTCLVGGPSELAEQFGALAGAGLTELMLLPSLERRYEALEDVARDVFPLL